MDIQYYIDSSHALRLRDPDGRTVVLDPSYWEARREPERYSAMFRVPENAPHVDIPDPEFLRLYSGISEYHSLGSQGGLHGYEQPNVLAIKSELEGLEKNVFELLKPHDPKRIGGTMYFRDLIDSLQNTKDI